MQPGNYIRDDIRDGDQPVARLLLAVFICATVVLLACGDRSSTATPEPSPSPTQIAQPTQTAIPTQTATVAPTPTATPTQTAIPPSPSPTLTPSPTPSAVSSPTPTLTPPPTSAPLALVTPSPTAAEIPSRAALADEAYALLEYLTEEYSPRESVTNEELKAAMHLEGRLRDLGYDTEIRGFDVVVEHGISSVLLENSDEALYSLPMAMSADGVVKGALAYVGMALEGDIPEDGLDGKIALIERGDITFREKVASVSDAGAVGAIVFNNMEGLFRGTLFESSDIPAVSISMADGRALLDALDEGEAIAMVSVNKEPLPSRNVIAERRGTGAEAGVVILGAHYDTTPATQGASDNGSGLSVVLTIAKYVAERDYPFAIRIILFGAEEIGLYGSGHYVDGMSEGQIESALAMLNFDALGSGSVFRINGDDALVDEATAIGEEMGMDGISVFSEEPWLSGGMVGASDHGHFRAAGIPVLVIFSDDFSRINSPADTIEHINPDLLGYGVEMGLGLLDWLAER